jgi:hypothetical protein
MSLLALKENYSQLKSDIKTASGILPFLAGLKGFFREQVTLEQAKLEIKKALDDREERFLRLVQSHIYQRPTSPYLRLLKHAGCEFSDLCTHVRQRGLENTLERLAREGVYLTSDEFKGKKEIVRGGLSFRVCPDVFELPNSRPGFSIQSSGTTNRPVRSLNTLDWIAMRAAGTSVFFAAHDLFSSSHALYDAILPTSAVNHLLTNAKLGIRTGRWFAPKIPVRNRLEGWYHYSATYLMVAMGKCFGPGFPRPEIADLQNVAPIVRWISEQKRRGSHCYIITVASSAARIARTAYKMGVSLEGTKFNVAGEPFTKAKEDTINKVGAIATSRYSYGGGVPVGYGCANPLHRDEVHVNEHLLAVVSQPAPLAGCGNEIRPILLTTLHPAAPRLLLNVENGDYVTLEERGCGCAMGKAGLTLHLHHIRSFEKFTSEGMNYFYGDLYQLLEKTFPSDFGGGPGDYQLVEEEDGNGQTRLSLVVHPEVGNLDEGQVLARLRAAFSSGSRGNRFMTEVWEGAGTFRIRREVPYASLRGKILPLHIAHANGEALEGAHRQGPAENCRD